MYVCMYICFSPGIYKTYCADWQVAWPIAISLSNILS